MQGALSTATWFWLFFPMLTILGLAIITYIMKR